MWHNTQHGYGLTSIVLHWVVAMSVLGLFALGFWMVRLDYYDPWSLRGPDLHKSIGILLFTVVIVRMLWRVINVRPQLIGTSFEQKTASVVHRLLYGILLLLMISGYFISTIDGRPIDMFGLFTIPAIVSDLEHQEDFVSLMHEWLSYGLMGLIGLHIFAALKHHFVDHDNVLKRMFHVYSK